MTAVVPSLSVIIITKNAAKYIGRCLESIRWANEIIVLDSGSEDETLEICQQYTEKVYRTDWPGYGPQKNRALALATQEWILSLDADEWLSDSLIPEIKSAMQQVTYEAFSLPIRIEYCGYWMRFGEAGKDRKIRLFKRGKGRFTDDLVHEKAVVSQNVKVGRLHHFLFHESYRTLEELLERMNRYTSLSAQSRHRKDQTSSLKKAIFHGVWAFAKGYLFRLGFLDGRIGFIVAITSAESSYYRHLKLAFKDRK